MSIKPLISKVQAHFVIIRIGKWKGLFSDEQVISITTRAGLSISDGAYELFTYLEQALSSSSTESPITQIDLLK